MLFVLAFFTVLFIIACNIVGLEALVANVYQQSIGGDVEMTWDVDDSCE